MPKPSPVDLVTRYWQLLIAILLACIAYGSLRQTVSDHTGRIQRLEAHEDFFHGHTP
jgi:hypothetical protein